MVKFEYIDKVNNVAMLSFSSMQMPTFKVNTQGGWVDYGKNNDFPNQLLRLYEEHEEHNAIVTAKANYLFGQSIKATDENQQQIVDNFFSFANRYEKWETLNEKIKVDCEAFNCFYLQIITDLTGKPKEYYHLQYSNVRTNKEKTKIWYSENWLDKQEARNDYEIYDFQSKKPGVYFIRFEFYKPTQNKLAGVYPAPQYIACVKSISTDIDISTFNNHYVANGFSAGTMITFFQDDPGEPAKRKLKDQILTTHTAPEKAGSVVLAFAGKEGQAPNIAPLNVDDLDKKFEFTSKRCLDKIIRGHNVTNPELFGVKTEGQLGTRVSLKESYELMLNTYTKPRQKPVLAFYSDLILMSTGQYVKLEIEQMEAIGLDLTNNQDLSVKERRDLLGYETDEPVKLQAQAVNDAINSLSPLVANKVLESMNEDEIRALASLPPKNAQLNPDGTPMVAPNGLPIAAQTQANNNHLTGLSAADNSDMKRIVRDYQKGVNGMNEHMAIDRLMGYGLSKEQANKWLGIEMSNNVKMSSQVDDFILAQFEAIDTTELLELELLHEEDAHIHNSKQALKFEFDMNIKFADSKDGGFLSNLVSGLLGKIGGNKNTKSDEPTFKTEILTKYKYALKPDAEPLKTTSRPFCKKMIEMNKEFTFEQIDSVRVAGLSNGMPEVDNIWDYRGGFYTHPDTNNTDPFCRHYWKAITYKVKTKI